MSINIWFTSSDSECVSDSMMLESNVVIGFLWNFFLNLLQTILFYITCKNLVSDGTGNFCYYKTYPSGCYCRPNKHCLILWLLARLPCIMEWPSQAVSAYAQKLSATWYGYILSTPVGYMILIHHIYLSLLHDTDTSYLPQFDTWYWYILSTSVWPRAV